MVAITTLLIIIIALGASFFAAWTIGAGSSGSTPFAPAVGTGAITTLRAAFIVGLLGLIGAVSRCDNRHWRCLIPASLRERLSLVSNARQI